MIIFEQVLDRVFEMVWKYSMKVYEICDEMGFSFEDYFEQFCLVCVEEVFVGVVDVFGQFFLLDGWIVVFEVFVDSGGYMQWWIEGLLVMVVLLMDWVYVSGYVFDVDYVVWKSFQVLGLCVFQC